VRLPVASAVASAVLAIALEGCGRPGAAGSRPASGPTRAPAPIIVAAGVRESTVSLRVGQAVLVRPAPGRAGPAQAIVAEVASSVLRAAGGSSAAGWRFVAEARGTAHIVVSYGPQCLPGELCPMFRGLLGRVTVTVE